MIGQNQIKRIIETGLLTAHSIPQSPRQIRTLRKQMTKYHVPGFSVAFIRKGEVEYSAGYGVKEVEKADPVTADTIFQAASINKPVTAMVVMRLVQEGILELDKEVNQLLQTWKLPENEFTRRQKVTLRGLLTHTAGISVSGYRGYPVGSELPTIQQVLNGEPPASCEPVQVFQQQGEGFSYSGGGYVIVQQVIEDVTGRTLADLAKAFIFEPLNMSNSTFDTILPERFHAQAATAHQANGAVVPGRWHHYPEQGPASLWSTAEDLAKLVIEIMNAYQGQSDRVLSPRITRLMLTPQLGWMGFGYVVVNRNGWTRFDHPGWNEGFHSYLSGYLGEGQGLIWMTNGENGRILGHEVMRGVAKLCKWPEFVQVKREVANVDRSGFAGLVGKYFYTEDPEYGVEITLEHGHLFMQESHGIRYELFPSSELSFFCLPKYEEIRFSMNESGLVNSMMIGECEHLQRCAD